jgi:hypothetical protein
MDGNTIMRFSGQVNRLLRVCGLSLRDPGTGEPRVECRKPAFALQTMPLLLVAHAMLQRR